MYCACVADDGLSCNSDRCICSDCHNTVAAKMRMEAADYNDTNTDSFDECFTKIEKGEKEDLFDSSVVAPAKDYDETVLFHDVQGLRIASPKNSPNGRNSAALWERRMRSSRYAAK